VYRRLGFTLTERGSHSLGSMNHLAIFGTDYLELIAVPKNAPSNRLDLLKFPLGLNRLVFGREDSAVTYDALGKASVPVEWPRPIAWPAPLPRQWPRDARDSYDNARAPEDSSGSVVISLPSARYHPRVGQ
jgi:hypothetical protein